MRKFKKSIYAIAIGLMINQAYGQYDIKNHSINNGGGKSSGGAYELNASIGQSDASSSMSNGAYSLSGGFWQQNNDLIFKNEFD